MLYFKKCKNFTLEKVQNFPIESANIHHKKIAIFCPGSIYNFATTKSKILPWKYVKFCNVNVQFGNVKGQYYAIEKCINCALEKVKIWRLGYAKCSL